MIDLYRPAAPQNPRRRDWFAPAVVAGSLVLHAAIVVPLIWSPRAEAARPPAETSVEVVQMPPEPPKPVAKPPAQAKAAEPPHPQQAQTKRQQASKPPAPKPETLKPAAPKTAAAKPQEPKPPAPKPPASKPGETERGAKRDRPPDSSVADRMAKLLGPMQAMVMPALASGDNPLDDPVSYRELVLSRVAKQKREDRHDGIPGHAVIAFEIGDRGEVATCEVREKSVDPKLDAEAVAMVYRGAPYPPPPPGAPRRFSFGFGFHVL